MGLTNGQIVSVTIPTSNERNLTFGDVVVRVSDSMLLQCTLILTRQMPQVWLLTPSVQLLNKIFAIFLQADLLSACIFLYKFKNNAQNINGDIMEFFQIIILSFVAMVVLFLLTKLMGFRQISEMSFFDYVIGITIGSIAAEMSTNIDLEWWKGITAMAVWAVIGVLLSVITQKALRQGTLFQASRLS